jgi:hypothetical protein
MKASQDPLRAQLVRLLDWEDAHVGFDRAIDGIPADRRGALAAGFEHSIWQLLEHMRIVQKDILDFCVNTIWASSWRFGKRLRSGIADRRNAVHCVDRVPPRSGSLLEPGL